MLGVRRTMSQPCMQNMGVGKVLFLQILRHQRSVMIQCTPCMFSQQCLIEQLNISKTHPTSFLRRCHVLPTNPVNLVTFPGASPLEISHKIRIKFRIPLNVKFNLYLICQIKLKILNLLGTY